MAGYKMKTHKGGAKRFKMTGSGKFKRKKAYLRHGMRKRSNDAKRSLRQKGYVEGSDHQAVVALKEQYTLARKGTHILKLPKDTEVAAVVYGELLKTQLSAPENILTVIVRFASAITDNCGS